MRAIGDGIRCDQQPPQDDCCGRPARHYIIVYGRQQWLCGVHYDDHIATRSFMHMDGENLDERGKAL
jgi:hypothetical protein